MDDVRHFQLLFGPYRMPRYRVGRTLRCKLRGRVRVTGISDGRIQWPQTRRPDGGGRPFLLVCGDLVRAIRKEVAIAICHWWGVTPQTVSGWRKALGVPEANDGTRRLHRDWFPERRDEAAMERWRQANKSPERAAKIAAAKRDKPRPKELMDRLHRRNIGRKHSEVARRKMSAARKRRGVWPAAAGRPWTPEEYALLGTMFDREVVAKIRRHPSTVFDRPKELGIPSCRKQIG